MFVLSNWQEVGIVLKFMKKRQNWRFIKVWDSKFQDGKKYINKRIEQMELEGVSFICNTEIGKDISFNQLNKDFDAIVFAGGAERPRDLEIPGRKLKGIHFAMDFLTQQNKRCEGDNFVGKNEILASNKDVVVIGGGDTGSDCIGTSNRQGAKSVTQLEIMEKPPAKENKLMTSSLVL